ncbi:hypothetical protein C9F11_41740 [Streptomyces sp. YIM 121038]|nr:hypothetical protein C9F11_41740 [Streptomyces sp. YIM 121038]
MASPPGSDAVRPSSRDMPSSSPISLSMRSSSGSSVGGPGSRSARGQFAQARHDPFAVADDPVRPARVRQPFGEPGQELAGVDHTVEVDAFGYPGLPAGAGVQRVDLPRGDGERQVRRSESDADDVVRLGRRRPRGNSGLHSFVEQTGYPVLWSLCRCTAASAHGQAAQGIRGTPPARSAHAHEKRGAAKDWNVIDAPFRKHGLLEGGADGVAVRRVRHRPIRHPPSPCDQHSTKPNTTVIENSSQQWNQDMAPLPRNSSGRKRIGPHSTTCALMTAVGGDHFTTPSRRTEPARVNVVRSGSPPTRRLSPRC